jgi:hypothetical protein
MSRYTHPLARVWLPYPCASVHKNCRVGVAGGNETVSNSMLGPSSSLVQLPISDHPAPEFKVCKFTTDAIITEGSDVGTIQKVCANPTFPVHHPKQQTSRDDAKWKLPRQSLDTALVEEAFLAMCQIARKPIECVLQSDGKELAAQLENAADITYY